MHSHGPAPTPDKHEGEARRLFTGGQSEPFVETELGSETPGPSPRLQLLTGGQIECLRLVDQHLTSEEIATRLGISRHTVDQRVRVALRVLGVENRWQAARLVTATMSSAHSSAAYRIPHVDELPGLRTDWQLPFATRGHPSNTMSVGTRLFWIGSIAISAMFAAGMYLAGLESLARMLQS